MKLKLTPEFFILQDTSPETSQDEKEEEIQITNNLENSNLKNVNRNKRFIDTPEFHLLNEQKNQLIGEFSQEIKQQQNNQSEILEPNIRIIERNGKIIYDKRFISKRRPKREVIQSDIRCVQLYKDKFGSSFGLTIQGGLEFNKPLIISNIQRNSAADKCRSLFLGDLIVELNGQSTYPIRLTHEQSMKLIKNGGNKLYLTVKHLTMYNRPIARCWQRQLNMLWLNNGENTVEEDWITHKTNQNKSIIDQSSINSSLNSTALKDNEFSKLSLNQNQLNEPTKLSNLTVSITTDKLEDSQTPSPNDEGVYTGLSNDALSSSECTESDASCFSSDYIQSSLNSNQQTNILNSNQNTYHHCNKSSLSLKNNEINFINESFLNCSSIDCKNRKNNNSCRKCIINKNHQNKLDNFQPVDQDFNKENSSNFSNFSFRSSDYKNEHSINCCLQNTLYLDQYQINGKQQTDKINSNEFCSCRNSSNETPSNRNSDNLVDIVSVNLINCYFTKYIYNTDNIRRNGMEVRWFDLHNKNLKKNKQEKLTKLNSAIISFNDNYLAEQFQEKISQYLSKLNESYMFSFNRGLKPEQRILFMGWISLAIPKTIDSNLDFFNIKNQQINKSLDYNWQPKYMIIKGGELHLYDYVPDYVLDKILYSNDTLMEFNELSDLLINKNGTLTCSITLNNQINNLNKSKLNTQLNRKKVSRSLTRHLSIRGQDSSIDLDKFNKFLKPNDQTRILSETNNNTNKGNRLTCTLTRNLSLKTAKENRFNKKLIDNKIQRTNDLHCTLPRNRGNQFNNQTSISQQSTLDRKQNLKCTTAASNLFTPNQYLLNQTDLDLNDQENLELKWQNKPIIFKAYQSVLRELKSDELLDRRENCLLALTTQSDNTVINNLNVLKKQSAIDYSEDDLNRSWYENNQNEDLNNEIKKQTKKSSPSMVAYLAVENPDNISEVLKSWSVSTMHSVVQISQKSFTVISEGNYCCLTLDWNKGFTLYDNSTSSNIKWSFKFSQLKNSSDNGENTLWLSFQSIKHQPVRQLPPVLATISNQSDNNSSLNSSMDSVDQYSQRSSTLNRAITPCSFDSSINSNTMNSTIRSSKLSNNNSYNNDYLSNNSNYLQTNRNEFKIKKSIETKELTCTNLQHLIYCIHSFLAAKVTNVSSMPTNQRFSNSIL